MAVRRSDGPAAALRSPLRGLFVLALLFTLREAQAVLAPVAIAIVLTFVLVPLVRALRARGIPEAAGAAIIVAALILACAGVVSALAAPAQAWWREAPSAVSQLLERLDRLRAAVPGLAPGGEAGPPSAASRVPRGDRATRHGSAAPPIAGPPAPDRPDPVKDRLAAEGVAFTGVLLGRGIALGLATAATVILLYFLLASEHWLVSRSLAALPDRRSRARVLGGLRAAQRDIGRYLLAVGCVNAGVGLIMGLALWAQGLPNPTLWGVVTAVLCLVPYLGPAALAGLLTLAGVSTFDGIGAMLLPAATFGLVHALETNAFSPWFVGRRLALSPIAIFVSVMLWGWLWGIAGALLAVPLLIALRIVCRRSPRLRWLGGLLEGGAVPPRVSGSRTPPARRPDGTRQDRGSEPVDVADAGHVEVVAVAARKAQAVPGPLEDHA